jgi:predicted glutamine amidotransferase
MCRLYGFHANEPTKVECSLVHAQNALLRQSVLDRRGLSHSDGWGISYYENGRLRGERRDTAAHADEHFSTAAERVYARTVVAHVRAATIGAHSLANTHPFVHQFWSFAHNGTVRGFEVLRPRLERETAPDLLSARGGDTDSETAFYWLLTRLRAAGGDINAAGVELELLTSQLADAIRALDAMCVDADPGRPARLNFILTNGTVMLASRWRNSLHVLLREGIHDCEICGIPHVHHAPGMPYRAAAIASEPITHEHWDEVPDGSIVAVGPEIEPVIRSFA